jgi:hypothetical protein
LGEIEAIVSDGDWIERFAHRLMHDDPEIAGEAAVEAIQDDEVMLPAQVAIMMCMTGGVNRAAAATALKIIWLDQGFGLPPAEFKMVFDSVASVPKYLMDPQGQEVFEGFTNEVTIHRGQLFDVGKNPDGASWTLSEEVAQWYSAPAPSYGSPERGWVLTATVPKSAVLAVFCERGEQEVVLDLAQLNHRHLVAKRGTRDKFPGHLAGSSLGFIGLLSNFL